MSDSFEKYNYKKFQKLKKICNYFNSFDQFLIKCNNLTNLINEHPHHLNKVCFFLKRSPVKTILNYFFYQIPKIFYKIIFCDDLKFNNIKKNKKIIIFSHLTDEKIIKQKKDHIFGDIFSKKKSEVAYVYLNSAITHKKKINPIYLNKFPNDICVMNMDVNFFQILKYFFFLINFFFSFKINKDFLRNNNLLNAYYIIKYNIISFDGLRMFAFRDRIKKILLNTNPKFVMTTFEGHGYEKIIFLASYEISPKIKRLGYQSSIISKYQNSIFINHDKKYMPDCILASGKNSYDRLKKKFNKIKVILVGSVRNINSKTIIRPKKIKKKNICLVAPEGLSVSEYKLFKFCYIYSKKFSNVEFIYRFHPETNIKSFFVKFPEFSDYKKLSIKLSNSNLFSDLKKSNLILYIQSTSVIAAVKLGLIALHLKSNDSLNLDILHEFKNSFKQDIYNIQGLNHFLNKNKNQKKTSDREFKILRDYCANIYTPFCKKKFFNILR